MGILDIFEYLRVNKGIFWYVLVYMGIFGYYRVYKDILGYIYWYIRYIRIFFSINGYIWINGTGRKMPDTVLGLQS